MLTDTNTIAASRAFPERPEKLRLSFAGKSREAAIDTNTDGRTKKDKNIMHDLPGYKNRNIS